MGWHAIKSDQSFIFNKVRLGSGLWRSTSQHERIIAIYETFCLDVAQGRMIWAPNENPTSS